jgi:hypothetical protein
LHALFLFLSANETVEKLSFLFRAYYSEGSKHKDHLRIARFMGIAKRHEAGSNEGAIKTATVCASLAA